MLISDREMAALLLAWLIIASVLRVIGLLDSLGWAFLLASFGGVLHHVHKHGVPYHPHDIQHPGIHCHEFGFVTAAVIGLVLLAFGV